MSSTSRTISNRIGTIGRARFGPRWAASEEYQAPGRIELIGNHLDYNGGPVLAAAIDRRIWIGVAARADQSAIRVVFSDLDDAAIHVVEPPWPDDWRSASIDPEPLDYLRGVVTALTRRGFAVRHEIDLVVSGDLPHGIGISSSAALCVALILAVSRERPDPAEIVVAAQEAEHRVGSPCGTMDQSASVHGGLIRYDGATDGVAPVAAKLGDHRLVVVNSGVVRSLATSSYPDRVRETARALQLLRDGGRSDITALAEIDTANLPGITDGLELEGESILARRVRHVVTETDRVNRAAQAIADGDWPLVGQLMNESGRSSAQDYEISHPSVEQIVAICQDHPGVLGARMMGGGQGGSALVLAQDSAVTSLLDRLDSEYFSLLGTDAPLIRILPCAISAGAGLASRPQAS